MQKLQAYIRVDGTGDLTAAGEGIDRTSDERGTTVLVGFWARGNGPHSASAAALHGQIARRGVAALADDGLTGQFAFVHHDRASGRLWAVTDRFGTRSLYVRHTDAGARVANHPGLLHDPGEPRAFDEGALLPIASHRRLLCRRTVVRDVARILPGSCLELSAAGLRSERRYWTLDFAPEPSGRPFPEEVDALERALEIEVGRAAELAGGGPVGVLLSGGVDSSVLAALCREAFPNVVGYTATIEGFADLELGRARTVARALGIEHRVVEVTDRDVERGFADLVALIGEPPQHQNNFVLDKLVRTMGRECRVGVFGWAADTLFGSGAIAQVRSYLAKRRLIRPIPDRVVRALGEAIRGSGIRRLYALGDALASGDRRFLARLGRIYYPPDIDRALSRRLDAVDWMPDCPDHWDERLDLETRSQRLDIYGTTGSALLRTERLCGAAGVVPWSPFLAEPPVRHAMSLDGSLKVRNGVAKPLMRALCDRHLPAEVSRWPKIGFDTPWDRWLAGPLAGATEEARSDPFVRWALDRLGCTVEQTRRSSELSWMVLSLSRCRAALDLRWSEAG